VRPTTKGEGANKSPRRGRDTHACSRRPCGPPRSPGRDRGREKSGAQVWWPLPTVTDNAGAATVACTPAAGSWFALGVTTVSCVGTDAHGNISAPSTFKVTVVDDAPPALASSASAVHAEATGASGASVSFPLPTAYDQMWGATPVTCAPAAGSTFPVGITSVVCSATDGSGNTAVTLIQIRDRHRDCQLHGHRRERHCATSEGGRARLLVPRIPGRCDALQTVLRTDPRVARLVRAAHIVALVRVPEATRRTRSMKRVRLRARRWRPGPWS
jgi:hypothetical protein